MTEFENIYREYFDDVYRYIRKLSGDETLAEEITSETFFKAMRSIGSFRGECDLRVWLCQIAKNCFYTHQKETKNMVDVDEEEILNLASEESVEEQCINRDEAAQIRLRVHELPEPYKEVFLWRVFGELSFKQIGQIFHKTENWACVTYHRAKTMIKSKLEDEKDEK